MGGRFRTRPPRFIAFIMNRHGAKIELWDNVKETFGLKKKTDVGKT
jgi:hypothetical protein